MAITAQIGTTPEYCFIADGRNLLVYIANGYARNTLTGTPANNDTVTIDTVYYKFTNDSVDAGTPPGTLANPWLVALGASSTDTYTNLAKAIKLLGIAGTKYSTDPSEHTTVKATA